MRSMRSSPLVAPTPFFTLGSGWTWRRASCNPIVSMLACSGTRTRKPACIRLEMGNIMRTRLGKSRPQENERERGRGGAKETPTAAQGQAANGISLMQMRYGVGEGLNRRWN